MTSQASWQHGYVVSNGVRLHYVTQGEGDLILMLHGFPEFWYSWRHQILEFAKNYKVVALDLRGYNDSEKSPSLDAYRMEELIQDVVGVIQSLGYSRCILVGHDWGGAIAWNVADTYPEYLSHLIVLNLPHPAKLAAGLRTPQQLMRSWYMFFFQIPAIPELVLQAGNCQIIEEMLSRMAIDKTAFTPEDLQAYKTAAAKPGALTAMLNYYRNVFQQGFLEKEWGKITVPTLMIWGENDTALGIELTYGTEQYVEDLTLRYIPNCSHWVQQEQPQLVNQYMWEFLQR